MNHSATEISSVTAQSAPASPVSVLPASSTKWTVSGVLVLAAFIAVMCSIFTGVMTYRNVGFSDTFFHDWLRAFGMVILTVKPLALMSMWVVSRIVGALMPKAKEATRNLVIGVIMACVMESIMAFMAAASHFGFTDMPMFLAGWWNGLMAALPVSLVVMPIMAMTVKPKIKQLLHR